MNLEKDILQSTEELKKNPYTVPEGYFDNLKKEVSRYPQPHVVHVSLKHKVIPWISFAAMFAFIAVLGHIFVRDAAEPDHAMNDAFFEDYIMYADYTTELAIYNYANETEEQEQDQDINEEDIIEYLIYTGISPEIIELYK